LAEGETLFALETIKMPQMRALGVAWYLPEDYQRIREISHDEMQPTFKDFEAKMARQLPQFQAQLPPGTIVEKVVVNPDELLAFASKFHGGKIDSKVRSAFAAMVVMKKYGADH
jgi:hypothetical protein